MWVGEARKPRPGPQHVAVEVFHGGRWLTHGDFAMEAEVDFSGCCGASFDSC